MAKKEPTTVQTLIFDKAIFKSSADAKKWAKDNEFHSGKVDETEDSFRLRQKDPGDFRDKSFKTISLSKGVKAVIGKLKEAMHSEMGAEQMEMATEPQLVDLTFKKAEFKDNDAVVDWAEAHGLVIEKISVPKLNLVMPLIDEWNDSWRVKIDGYEGTMGCHLVHGQVADGVSATVAIPHEMDMAEALHYYESLKEAGSRHTKQEMMMIDEMIKMLKKLKDGKKAEIDEEMKESAPAYAFREAFSGFLLESADAEGKLWKVCIIEAGKSKNKRNYSKAILEKAASIFEGKSFKIYGRAGKGKVDYDHLTNSEVYENPKGFWQNTAGFFKNVKMEGERLVADLNIFDSESDLRKKLKSAWQEGANVFGLSIDASGDMDAFGNVTEIKEVNSVDLVDYPAAGGTFLRLVAGLDVEDMPKEASKMDLMELIKQLVESTNGAPEKLKELATKEPELFASLKKLTEGTTTTTMSNGDDELRELMKGLKKLVEEQSAQPKPEPAAPIKESKIDDNGKLAELEKKVKLGECRFELASKLAESKLPEIMKERIRKRFNGRLFESVELAEAMTDELALCAKLAESKGISFGDQEPKERLIEITRDEYKKKLDQLDESFKPLNAKGSIRRAYIELTGDEKITGHMPENWRFREAITTTGFADVLRDVLHKRAVATYREDQYQDWRKIVSEIIPLSDFKTVYRVRYGGYGTLPTVSQSQAYTALTTPTDEQATYSPTKRGGTEEITLESIKNDDIGLLRDVPRRLGRAAANTLSRFVFDFIDDNANIYDSTALFTSGHANLGSAALTYANLEAAIVAIRDQTAYGDTSDVLGLRAKWMLVPNELAEEAFQLAYTVTRPGTSNRDNNYFATLGLEMVVVPYWTDANNWYLVVNTGDCPTIEIGFMDGQEEPELYVQDMPNVGSLFNNDVLTYKIKHVYGGAVLDFRGFYGAVVT